MSQHKYQLLLPKTLEFTLEKYIFELTNTKMFWRGFLELIVHKSLIN